MNTRWRLRDGWFTREPQLFWVVSIHTNRKVKMSCVELFLFILKEHFKESNHIRHLDQSSHTGNSHIKYCIVRASSTRDLEWFTLTLKTLLYQYKLIYCYWVTHPTDYTFLTCGDLERNLKRNSWLFICKIQNTFKNKWQIHDGVYTKSRSASRCYRILLADIFSIARLWMTISIIAVECLIISVSTVSRCFFSLETYAN